MKIGFKAYTENTQFSKHFPIPAKQKIPAWYPRIPKHTDNEKKFKFFQNGNKNTTIKFCNPFLDSLTIGYSILLEGDVFVEKTEDGGHSFTWPVGGERFIVAHDARQISPDMIPSGYNPIPFKFQNNWSAMTPAGYSLLFVHPLNRTDLPFFTLSGVVDTDDYHVPVEFPFFIKSDFEGIIPAGTPIAQAIPIKREPWSSQVTKFDKDFTNKTNVGFFSTIYRPYKNLFWKRKDYR